jgi:hypothetical protein
MTQLVRIPIVIFLLLSIHSCTFNQEGSANEHFVEASTLIYGAKINADNYGDILSAYNSAESIFDLISSKYAITDIAVQLHAGEIKIGGLNYEQFKSLRPILVLLSNAEQNPLSCSELIFKRGFIEVPKSAQFVRVDGNFPFSLAEIKSTALAESLDLSFENYRKIHSSIPMFRKSINQSYSEPIVKPMAFDHDIEGIAISIRSVIKAERGDFNGAIDLIEGIKNPKTRIDALTDVANLYSKSSSVKLPEFGVDTLYSLVLDTDNIQLQWSDMIIFSRAFSKVGNSIAAYRLLSGALENTKTRSNTILKTKEMIEIANAFLLIDCEGECLKLLADAIKITRTIDDDFEVSLLALDIVNTYIRLDALSQAEHVVVPDRYLADLSFAEIAALYFLKSNYEEGKRLRSKVRNALVVDVVRIMQMKNLLRQNKYSEAFQELILVKDNYLRAVGLKEIGAINDQGEIVIDDSAANFLKSIVSSLFPIDNFWKGQYN